MGQVCIVDSALISPAVKLRDGFSHQVYLVVLLEL
jgi:hypothetical protein